MNGEDAKRIPIADWLRDILPPDILPTPRDEYLGKLGEINRRRYKPEPAEQDIDLLTIFEPKEGEPEPAYDQLGPQLKYFDVFHGLIKKLVQMGNSFRIGQLKPPFASPGGYMRQTGSITLKAASGGMPIELTLTNCPFHKIGNPIMQGVPYSVILDTRGGNNQ